MCMCVCGTQSSAVFQKKKRSGCHCASTAVDGVTGTARALPTKRAIDGSLSCSVKGSRRFRWTELCTRVSSGLLFSLLEQLSRNVAQKQFGYRQAPVHVGLYGSLSVLESKPVARDRQDQTWGHSPRSRRQTTNGRLENFGSRRLELSGGKCRFL